MLHASPNGRPRTGQEQSAAMARIVDVESLTKRFGETAAVDGLDLAVAEGTTLALLGGNGAGKTTTISMLLGLLLPTSGTIRLFGRDAVAERDAVVGRINFSSPYVELPHRLTVKENLTVYARLYGVKDVAGRLRELENDLDLGAFMKRQLRTLSAGQKTRVGLAKALVNRPRLLLLDEPTASLDPDTADWVRGLLEEDQRRHGTAIVLASHNMGEVERMAHDVVMMASGRVVDTGAPAALIAKYGRGTMEEVFLDIARGRKDQSAAADLLARKAAS